MTLQPVLIRIPFQPGLTGPQRVERQRHFARLALDHCAKLAGAPAGPWPQTPERVPVPRDGFHWSIAHKPRFAAAVIARVPVGIDIESLAPRDRDLSAAVASPEEWALIKQSRDPAVRAANFSSRGPEQSRDREGADIKNSSLNWRAFFELWTAKEAALKANSAGIGGLKSCRLSRIDKSGRFVMTYLDRESVIEHLSYASHVAACTGAESRLHWHVIGSVDPSA